MGTRHFQTQSWHMVEDSVFSCLKQENFQIFLFWEKNLGRLKKML